MRTIRVSDGYSGDVEVELTDTKGQDLSPAVFKVGLIAYGADIPDSDNAVWQPPDAKSFPKVGQAMLTIRPPSDHPLGRFWPHVLVIDSGRAPELVLAHDLVELT